MRKIDITIVTCEVSVGARRPSQAASQAETLARFNIQKTVGSCQHGAHLAEKRRRSLTLGHLGRLKS
jgi:hypothetical protein